MRRDSSRLRRRGNLARWLLLGNAMEMRRITFALLVLAHICCLSAQEVNQEGATYGPRKSTQQEVQTIISAIRDAPANGETKRTAVLALIEIEDTAKYDVLVEALDDTDNNPLARIAIAQVLIHLTVIQGDMDAVLPLIRSLGKDSCLYAFMVLAHLKDRAANALIQALDKKDDSISRHVGWLLGIVGEPAVPSLIEKLKDEELHVRKYAAFALGEIEDKKCVPSLISLLDDESEEVRVFAAEALGKITSKHFGNPKKDIDTVAAKWLGWWTETGKAEYRPEGN